MQAKLLGGRFHIGPQLGGHRTGEVFAADDATTNGQVVVKVVAGNVFPTPLIAQRTERELKQLQKVTVGSRRARPRRRQAGQPALDRGWRWSSGVPLAEVVQANGPLPLARAIRVAIEIGEALAEAAKVGVIHRDV